jgi:D-sedoheptulose 7-phosphate isomerase
MISSDYTIRYLEEAAAICTRINRADIDAMVALLLDARERGGRIFVLGVGGGAGNAAHAVNDFRKIAGIEAYAPTDNVSELTARTNDEGWHTVFRAYLQTSRLRSDDVVFVFSVGGGSREKNISVNIVEALKFAGEVGARITGIVGRDGGYTRKVADAAVVIPTISPDTVTPHTEAFQAVIWHLIVSHPDLKQHEMKWEAIR